MKPSVQKILTKLAKEQEKQTIEKLEKIELARKPSSIQSDAKRLNGEITKGIDRIDKAFVSYFKAWNEFKKFLDNKQSETERLDRDISDVMDALQELGVDFTKIPELSNSADIILKVENDIKNLRKLYPKP